MTDRALRASEAARLLGLPTKDVLELMRDRKLAYVMVDGIAHVPASALEAYRSTAG